MKQSSRQSLRMLYLAVLVTALAATTSWSAVLHVNGGAAALQSGITGASTGDEIILDDSLDYAPVSITKQLYIHAAAGQTPRVVSDPAVNGGTAVSVSSAGVGGGVWAGINAIQTVVGGGGGHPVFATFRTSGMYTVSNCTVSIESASSVDAKCMFAGAQMHLVNVSMK